MSSAISSSPADQQQIQPTPAKGRPLERVDHEMPRGGHGRRSQSFRSREELRTARRPRRTFPRARHQQIAQEVAVELGQGHVSKSARPPVPGRSSDARRLRAVAYTCRRHSMMVTTSGLNGRFRRNRPWR